MLGARFQSVGPPPIGPDEPRVTPDATGRRLAYVAPITLRGSEGRQGTEAVGSGTMLAGVALGVAVASGVGVAVGLGKGVAVADGAVVGAAVGASVGSGAGVGVAVDGGMPTGLAARVPVAVAVPVGAGVGVGLAVGSADSPSGAISRAGIAGSFVNSQSR